MKIQLTVTGTKPLLMSNERLVNPLNPYTQRLAQITKKRNKTLEDHTEIMMVEARGSVYETEEGYLGLPDGNLWSSIQAAAKAYKLGEDIKRGLLFEDIAEFTRPIQIGDRGPIDVEEFLSAEDSGHIFYRSAVVNRKRIMRSRPRVPIGWQSVHAFELLDDVLDFHQLTPVFERAGRLVGLGDWRPIYGTYRIEANEL